jgi:hypothetical protein
MRKLFMASLMAGLVAFLAHQALAQSSGPLPLPPDEGCNVDFDVDVFKSKVINITKNVTKNFTYDLTLEVTIIGLPQWAEVEAYKCDSNVENHVVVNSWVSTDTIINSFNGFAGIAQVNQAAGISNNQGNIMAAGVTSGPTGEQTEGISMVEAAVQKTNVGNTFIGLSIVTLDSIASSFNGFSGLAQVNQAAGCLNNQDNVLALGKNLNTTGIVAENDTFLSMSNTTNNATLSQAQTTAKIDTSFNGFSGAAQVNQSPGMLNNQCNIISIAHAGP